MIYPKHRAQSSGKRCHRSKRGPAWCWFSCLCSECTTGKSMRPTRLYVPVILLTLVCPALGRDIELRVSVKVIVSAKSIQTTLADKTWPNNITQDTFLPDTSGAL